MQRDFRASAQSKSEWRGHYRLGREFNGLRHALRLAPTEKFPASLVITNASKSSPGPPDFKVCEMSCTMSLPMVFIFEWNSMQPIPSPKFTKEAPEFFLTTPLDFFATSTDHTPAGTSTGLYSFALRST